MFADIEADVYVLVDGDDTYDAAAAPDLVDKVVRDGYDVVNGARVSEHEESSPRARLRQPPAQRPRLPASSVVLGDMLSGYKALSRRFVKSFPVFASGFEIERS